MTESQKQFLLWFKTTNQTLEMKDWSNICYQAAWNHQKKRIDEQLATIKSLNECINGKDSLTTDNLTIVGRIEQRIDELESNLKIAVDALTSIAVYNGGLCDAFSQIIEDEVNKALKQIEVK